MATVPEMLDSWEGSGLRIMDSERRVRALISVDGTVTDWKENVMAYIEANGDVGSHEMDFLGTAQESSGQVVDRNDAVVGEFDQGRGYVKNPQGSVIAEITKEGSVKGNKSQTAGTIQGFRFEHMVQVAAYVLLVDPDFVDGY